MGLTTEPLTMLAFIVLALAAGALAQNPQPCDGPASFTARFRHFDRERRFYVEGKMFYDHANRRIREFEMFDINRTDTYYDKLKLYNLNTEYRVDLKTHNCSVGPPHRPWHPWGVPPEAKFIGSGTIGVTGLSQESVAINLFEGNFTDGSSFGVTVTQPDCFVVEMIIKDHDGSYEHREFYDIVSGITDPSAFNIPEACHRR